MSSVCALKNTKLYTVLVSVNRKQRKWPGPSPTLVQPIKNVASAALKGGLYFIGFWVQIKTIFRQNQGLCQHLLPGEYDWIVSQMCDSSLTSHTLANSSSSPLQDPITKTKISPSKLKCFLSAHLSLVKCHFGMCDSRWEADGRKRHRGYWDHWYICFSLRSS